MNFAIFRGVPQFRKIDRQTVNLHNFIDTSNSLFTMFCNFKTLWMIVLLHLLLNLLQAWYVDSFQTKNSNECQTKEYVLLFWRLAGEWVWGEELGGEHMWPDTPLFQDCVGGFYMYCAHSLTMLYGRTFSYLCLCCIRGRWGSWGSNMKMNWLQYLLLNWQIVLALTGQNLFHGPCLTVSNKQRPHVSPKAEIEGLSSWL